MEKNNGISRRQLRRNFRKFLYWFHFALQFLLIVLDIIVLSNK